MPGIVMNCKLLPHLYVLVSEPTSHFPANKIMNLPNIPAFASKSANMKKRDLKVFVEQVQPDIHGKSKVWYFFWLFPGPLTEMTNYTALQSPKVLNL